MDKKRRKRHFFLKKKKGFYWDRRKINVRPGASESL